MNNQKGIEKENQTEAQRLILQLKNSQPHLRSHAAEALGDIRSEKSIPHLIDVLDDKDPDVRLNAALSLGKIGSHEAIPKLIGRKKEESSFFRHFLDQALGKIRKKLIENKAVFTVNEPIHFAFMHINPVEFPRAFNTFLGLVKKGKNKKDTYWKLTAKQLIVMEDRLK
ncbi:HEAT repeat domain-containing protein [Candidatus Micrarchaeota archaeon]|nr:HEAT repeat domain-containing protein [Candidatus Micrarchaeota archaeon]